MKRALLLTFLLALLLAGTVSAGKGDLPPLDTLQPGQKNTIEQDLTVNAVFVGYEPGAGDRDIDEAAFLGELPEEYRPVNRFPSFYQGNDFLGLTFNFDYNLLYADEAFEDAFFGYLGSIAEPQPLTVYQEAYNDQASASLEIAENYWIDAPSVEQWLADNAGDMLGVDTSQYTVFFVNWYGRDDFMHHVYVKTDEPDPDTGYNFGLERESRKLIAWGGTTPDDEESGLGSLHRLWFYDLSAGPEYNTTNWLLDIGDLNGNGVIDYRMPPVWEYGNLSAYRPFDTLSQDLGLVLRYVGIDLLFTTSPLYRAAISPPELPGGFQVDVSIFDWPNQPQGIDYFVPSLISSELNEVQPLHSYNVELSPEKLDRRLADVYNCFFEDADSCYGFRLFNIAFGDLFLYFSDHLLQFLEGDADYEIPLFAFNTPTELSGGLLGFADDNWTDGTQSYVFAFDSPELRDFGYGFSTTTIHEVGHHIGLSHPHDGYDYEANVDFGPGDEYYFAWVGDESNSMMSYIDLNWDFSQFDRDNMARYLTVEYLDMANLILADIAASPRAGQVSALLESADNHATLALASYQGSDWAAAAGHAKAAFDDIVAAAGAINVKIEPQAWQADYKARGQSDKFIDTLEHRLAP